MNCPHCASPTTKEQTKKKSLGYRTFRCSACRRTFNERTGILFNFLEYPTDIVLQVVLWREAVCKDGLEPLSERFYMRASYFARCRC